MAKSTDLDLEESERDVLEKRVISLLKTDAVETLAGVSQMYFGSEILFQSASLLPEVRPVLRVDQDRPEAVVMLFQLHVDYFSGEGSKSITMSMDRDDLTALRRLADEALGKWDRLASFLETTGMLVAQQEDQTNGND